MATRLIEKPEHPSSNLAIVGLYWIRQPKMLEACIAELFEQKKTTKGEYQLTDALQLMLERGEPFRTFAVDGWYDCGKPETLLTTNRHLLEKLKSSASVDGALINPPVYVAPTAVITKSIIGPFTTVGDGAVVTESIVRNSIIGTDARVTKALLEGSLVGNNASVEGDFQRINIGDSSEINFH
jgi:glucose-1-phosphate thymidylyltransferase